jgi:hypothetical protein
LDLSGLVNKKATPSALLGVGLLTGLYALLLSSRVHRRVILHEDAIEVLGWFSTRKLKRSEILGYRLKGKSARQAVGGRFYIIIPSDMAARKLRLPSFLNVDKDFFSWMDGIPKIKNEGRGAKSR